MNESALKNLAVELEKRTARALPSARACSSWIDGHGVQGRRGCLGREAPVAVEERAIPWPPSDSGETCWQPGGMCHTIAAAGGLPFRVDATKDHRMNRLVATVGALSLSLVLGACSSAKSSGGATSADDTQAAKSCKSSSECQTGEYCALSDNASCGSTGTCTAKPAACPQMCLSVCGCDGVTYDNYCYAQLAGTNMAFGGFCEESPAVACWPVTNQSCTLATAQTDCNAGGPNETYKRTGSGNPTNEYCSSALYRPTLASCAIIPDGCDATGGYVCGRDGKTYHSECDAYWTGRVGVAYTGSCDGRPANCLAASDCTGMLPKSVEACADGTDQPAAWECNVSGQCVIGYCASNGGVTSADGGVGTTDAATGPTDGATSQ
jgi:hypothetical protein